MPKEEMSKLMSSCEPLDREWALRCNQDTGKSRVRNERAEQPLKWAKYQFGMGIKDRGEHINATTFCCNTLAQIHPNMKAGSGAVPSRCASP